MRQNTRRFSPPNMLCPTTSSDSDSHGVSDPSGQARGHCRARAAGSLTPWFPASDCDTGRSAAGGKERRPYQERSARHDDEVSEHERDTGRRKLRALRRSLAETRRRPQ